MKPENVGNEPSVPPHSHQHRCIVCDGSIEISAEHDIALGLSLPLGLVSDECALICNACTSKLIAARQAQEPAEQRRRRR